MSLEAEEFSAEKRLEVLGFSCGDDEWSVHAAEWITADPKSKAGVFVSLSRGTKVWLYYAAGTDDVVGFAALGPSDWSVPSPTDPKRRVSYIPQLAVSIAFQGKGFGRIIVQDVIARAESLGHKYLTLVVHPKNLLAIALYKKLEFHEYTEPDRYGNLRMFRIMHDGL